MTIRIAEAAPMLATGGQTLYAQVRLDSDSVLGMMKIGRVLEEDAVTCERVC